MGLFNNPAKDAKKIHETIDYRVLKAAWDSYSHKHVGKHVTTPAWFALFSVQNYKGDFSKFDSEELHLLKALTNVNEAYDSIIEALEKSKNDEELARQILVTHPNLEEAVPDEYNDVEKINEYIVAVIKQYQLLLEEFYSKYKKKIDLAVESLEQEESTNQLPP